MDHARLLCESYERWTGRPLIPFEPKENELAWHLFRAPFALVSHGTGDDPVFNFGNQTALRLFEMTWDEFIKLPSRLSAEPLERSEREALLARVSTLGFIDDYRGVRISSSGRRFLIENATVWNLVDAQGVHRGQAAKFDRWSYL